MAKNEELDDKLDVRSPQLAYHQGFVDGTKHGIEYYAWWKDGVQYVGSCGTTLKEALEKVKNNESEADK